MSGRLANKAAVVVGAGQTPGETIGNGRATALRFAEEGAAVLCVDLHADRAEETAALIRAQGGLAAAHAADVTIMADCQAILDAALVLWGRVDCLVNNVGVGAGDGPAHVVSEETFDHILAVNLKSAWMTIRCAVPIMRRQGGGSIVNISSLASRAGGHLLAYEVSKAGVNRLTTSVALSNARYGVRCNAVLPGLMDTPMAVAGIAVATGRSIEDVRSARNAQVPLRGRMGTGWDTANAALYLSSAEADFVTGALLPVDGGMGVRIG